MNLVSRAVRGAALILFVLGAGVVSSGQVPQPTKTPEKSEEPTFTLVGDMLVTPEQFALMFGERNQRQGASIYTPDRSWMQPWPLGIVPIRFAPGVPQTLQATVWRACAEWGKAGPVVCIPHTVERQYVHVKTDEPGCSASLGPVPGSTGIINLGPGCAGLYVAVHELGHILGFWHEHQRADRDEFIEVDIENVHADARYAFNVVSAALHTPYDFFSAMHYDPFDFAIERRPTIIARPAFAELYAEAGAEKARRSGAPSAGDLAAAASIYSGTLRAYGSGRPTEPVQLRFSRDDFLGAMNQLHGFYQSSLGLHRPNGVSLGGRPDFLAIAQWIFDVYLGARSAGFSRESAFDIVVAAITQTEEWKAKHPGARSLTPTPFSPYVSFDRNEFLSTLERLDRFYSSAEGLQRPDGLSIDGAPDFQGIATWIFDVYLSQRLTGASPNAAWIAVENAIKATEEWRRKH